MLTEEEIEDWEEYGRQRIEELEAAIKEDDKNVDMP
jgi:hypothetical protein